MTSGLITSRPRRSASALLATGLATALLTGCGTDSGAGAAEEGTVSVVAAFYPLAYAAERVAGDRAQVDNLTTPGAEPHDLELSISQTADVAAADLVVVLGDFQPAVDAAVEENAEGEVLDVTEVVELRPFEEHAGGDQDAAEGEAAEDGHEARDLDPHFWQDPLLMADLGDAVAERLGAIDPDGEEEYAASAAALRSDLEELDRAYTDGLSGCARDAVVVSHEAFGYLTRYDLVLESIAGLSPDSEPTAADLARLQDIIAEEGVTTVFSETLVSPAIAEALARDTGVGTGVLDPVEGLSDSTAGEDYLSLMRANLDALREANDC